MGIPSQPEMFVQGIQAKSETPKHEYLYVCHYIHIWSCSTSLLHIVCLIITIILIPGILKDKS